MLQRALSSYGARGKFGEHERSVRVARGDSRGQLGFIENESVGFCGGRKTGEPGESPRSKVRTNNKLISPKSNPGHIGERRAHSPQHHPCFLQEDHPMLNTQVAQRFEFKRPQQGVF